jgi:thiol-disulfide isomerase/thioredoxin
MSRTLILTLLSIAAFLAAGAACRRAAAPVAISNRPASINDVKITKPLDEMSWTDEHGTTKTVADLRGKAVILDFWATYCIPCKEEIPHLNQLKADFGDRLEVIGLHAGGEEDRPKIPEFRTQTGMEYTLAYPEDDLLSFVFANDSRIPQTLVIDPNGKMVKKIVGFDQTIKADLDKAVQLAVGE